jgi:hypothetical protein
MEGRGREQDMSTINRTVGSLVGDIPAFRRTAAWVVRRCGGWVAAVAVCASAAQAADLSVGDVTMPPGATANVVVSGSIAGETTYGVTVLIEIVSRGGNTGTVTFTPAPPVDVSQAGDAWPAAGTFTPFDTDSPGFSATLNGSVDDDGVFLGAAVSYTGPLSTFPVVASSDASGVWDIVLTTSSGNAAWENVTTTRTPGTLTVTSADCFVDGDCDDSVACTDDACVGGNCVNAPNDANCDDGLFCNGVETCDLVLDCQSGSDPCDDGVACTDDACDEPGGSCINTPNDANCPDDGLFCNGMEACDPLLGCGPTSDPCPNQLCDEVGNVCTGCQFASECADALFCNGAETCVGGFCVPGTEQCAGEICDELNDSCLSDEAILTAEDLVVQPGTSGQLRVSGNIAGASTFGITILVELVSRPGNIGTLTFTPSPPPDIVQLGDPWPGTGTFSGFDTDAPGFAATLNGSVDDNGNFVAAPVTFSGVLAGFPVSASPDAGGTWDVVLTTTGGDSTWEGVTTTLNAGVISVPPSVGLSVQSRAMPPGSVVDLIVEGSINGESTFGVTVLAEVVPRPGATGTLTFTAAPPVDVRALGDPWPAGGTFTAFDTNAPGFSSVLNGAVNDNGTFSPAPVTFTGPLAAFPIEASAGADGAWDIVLSTSAGASGWEGLTTGITDGTITVTATACVGDPDCDDSDVCTDDVCDLGFCRHTFNAAPCDDGDQCTAGDACSLGVCSGTPIQEGSGCDDLDLCTLTDVCIGGLCAGTAIDCTSLDSFCSVGTCDPGTGVCELGPINEGVTCDDGDLCTVGDACSAGVCLGSPTDCTFLDDQCAVGTCSTVTGACQAIPLADGTICDDGDNCTLTDECSGGACLGTPVDCSSLDSGCIVGACNAATGLCEPVAVNENEACNDANPCTVNDICIGGSCAGSPKDCSALDTFCSIGSCNASTGVCQRTAVNEGVTCDDGFPCTTGDQCTTGFCTGTLVGTPSVDLELQAAPTVVQSGDLFDVVLRAYSGTCADQPTASIALILDWDPAFVRLAGKTPPAQPWPSSQFPNDSSLDGLNAPFTGLPANDGDAYYQAFAGFPLSRAVFVPEAGSIVTTFRFEALDAVTNTPITILPSAGSFTQTRVLRAGAGAGSDITGLITSTSLQIVECQIGADCSDGNVCTNDVCTGGICTNPNNTSSCDDGLFCTSNDVCSGGSCIGSNDPCAPPDLCSESLNACVECLGAADCVDGNVCTNDLCDASGACTYQNNTVVCNDNLFCTATDRCTGGACVGTGDRCPGERCNELTDACVQCLTDTDCFDGNPCTDEVCNNGVCQITNNTNPCNDALFCTANDVCSGGACVGSVDPCSAPLLCSESLNACVECLTASHCNDNNPCTTDQCIGGICTNTNNTSVCDDGLFCTATDRCSGGSCVGTGNPCSGGTTCDEANSRCVTCFVDAECNDGIACTVDTCSAQGACLFSPSNNFCSDGLFCNGQELCDVAFGGCRSPGNPCDAPSLCNESTDRCGCQAPVVSAEGARYIRVRPAGGVTPVAIRVRGATSDSRVSCVDRFVQQNGTLGASPVFRTPADWDVVHVRGTQLIPLTAYTIQSDCRANATLPSNLSTAVTATTWHWGDVDNDIGVDFIDIGLTVEAYKNNYVNVSLYNADLYPCLPDRIVDFNDIGRVVEGYKSIPFPCANPCP